MGTQPRSNPSTAPTNPSAASSGMRKSRGFAMLHDDLSLLQSTVHGREDQEGVELTEMHTRGTQSSAQIQLNGQKRGDENAKIWVQREVDVHFSR
jgi:hypothetical protein